MGSRNREQRVLPLGECLFCHNSELNLPSHLHPLGWILLEPWTKRLRKKWPRRLTWYYLYAQVPEPFISRSVKTWQQRNSRELWSGSLQVEVNHGWWLVIMQKLSFQQGNGYKAWRIIMEWAITWHQNPSDGDSIYPKPLGGVDFWASNWSNEIMSFKGYWKRTPYLHRAWRNLARHRVLHEQPTSYVYWGWLWEANNLFKHSFTMWTSVTNWRLDDNIETLEDKVDVTRRMRYMKRFKEQLRRRWVREYLRALDERKRQQAVPEGTILPTGRVFLINDSLKSKGQWRTGRIERQVNGRDGVVRGHKIRTGNGYIIARPMQLRPVHTYTFTIVYICKRIECFLSTLIF